MIHRPRIILANDDGLHSGGLKHLERELSSFTDVWAIAPDRERSGTSQAISIRETLRLNYVQERHYTVNGFPVDCINVALHSGKFPPFDLVVSGINHGYNLGDDIHYSGTMGAARHGAIHGYRAVAVSCPIREPDGDFSRPARFTSLWIQENYERLTPGVVYNINYPEESETDPRAPFPPVRYTSQGSRIYNDQYEELEEGEGFFLFRLKESVMGHMEEIHSDFHAVGEGFISITPVRLDTTHYEELNRWTPKSPKEKS